MEKNNVGVELTEELFKKISGDKQQQIAQLRMAKAKILSEEEALYKDLKDLEAKVEEIKGKIRLTEELLNSKEKNKRKLNKKIKKQIRLSNNINKIFADENPQYVYVDRFYPEKPKTKKR